jgi:hypothetical protein
MIALALATSWTACRKIPEPPASLPPASTRSTQAPKPETKVAPADLLCRGRPRCSVVNRLPIGSEGACTLLTLRLAAPADAAADQDRCNRREYWLSRPAGDVLLAVDCEAQWGADNAGPALLSVTGNLATFRYVEFLANDACELVEATVRLPEARIEAQTRHFGTVVRDQCRGLRKPAPVVPPGTGKADSPLVVLHRQ